MAHSLEPSTREALDLGTFLDHIKATVKFDSEESLLGAADALKGLANNKTFLAEWLNANLSSELSFPESGFIAGVTALAVENDFTIRANVWLPPRGNSLDAEADSLANSYLSPHDHNFMFLTVGYLGPGYRTEIYEYDPSRTHGYAGEHVELQFLEDTTLPEGKVMLYRESRDVHIQHHSTQFSVSLNILSHKRRFLNTQRFFDLGTSEIVRTEVASDHKHRAFFCRIGGLLGNDETYEILESIANDPSSDSTSRWYALESCAQLQPHKHDEMMERATRDANPYLAGRAAARLADNGG